MDALATRHHVRRLARLGIALGPSPQASSFTFRSLSPDPAICLFSAARSEGFFPPGLRMEHFSKLHIAGSGRKGQGGRMERGPFSRPEEGGL